MAVLVGCGIVGIATETPVLIAIATVMFVGFVPFVRFVGRRTEPERTGDERTLKLRRRSMLLSIYLLYGAAGVGFFVGAFLKASGTATGIAATLYSQSQIVFVWNAAALIVGYHAASIYDWVQIRRLEG